MKYALYILLVMFGFLPHSAEGQVTLFDESFNGGVVTRSFSPDVSSADSTGIQWNFSFPEGSTIIKAYLIAGRQGDAAPLDIRLNAFRVRFDDLTQVTPSFVSEFYGDSTTVSGAIAKVAAVHVADITTIVRPETDGMYFAIPRQGIVSRRYSDFTLFVAYEQPDAAPIHSTVVLNTQSFSEPVLHYDIPVAKYACGDFAFGFSAGYVCNNTFDKISVNANGVFLGDIGGPEQGNICAGPGAEFDLYNGVLSTTEFDNPDQKMDENDLVSNLAEIVSAQDTVLSVDMGTVSSNAVWALIVAYNTIPDTITVLGPTEFCSPDASTLLIAPDGYSNYEWSDGTRSQSIQPTSTGTWTVSMDTPTGCRVSLSQDIVVFAETLLEVSRDTLDFGLVAGCTNSAEKALTIRNNGDSLIAIESIVFTDPAFFLTNTVDNVEIEPGDSLTVQIQFSPGASGSYEAIVQFETTPCASNTQVVLVGFGQSSLLRTSVTSIDFGYVTHCPSNTVDTTIVIYNDLNEVVVLSRPEAMEGFDVVSPAFPVDVFARDSVVVRVQFIPDQPKRFSEVLNIPFRSFTCSDTLAVSLTSRSIEPRLQNVGPSLLAEPVPMCQTPQSSELRLYNSDLVPVVIHDIQYDDQFLLLNIEELPIVIAPERSTTIPVEYLQTEVGSFIGSIAVITGEECVDTSYVEVGSTLVTPQLRVVDRINFGDRATCDGNQFERVLAVSNITKRGFGAKIESVTVEGPFTTTMQAGDTLRAQTTESFSVVFAPPNAGTFNGRIVLTYGPCALQDTIELSGTFGELSVASSEVVQFASIAAGQTAQETGTFINTGDVAVFVDSVTTPTTPFSIAYTSHDIPGFVPPGDTLLFLIAFTPQQSDSYSSTLVVHTAECVDTLQLNIHGNGYVPGAAPVVRIPQIEAEYKDTISIPLLLERKGSLSTAGASQLSATFELPYDQLLVLESSVGVLSAIEYPTLNRQRIIVDSIPVAAGVRQGDTLVKLSAVVLFGEEKVLPLDISSGLFAWAQGVEVAQTVPGRVTITDYCFGYSVSNVNRASIQVLYPNPTRYQLNVTFVEKPTASVGIQIHNGTGQLVHSLQDVEPTRSVLVSLPHGLPRGVYYLTVFDVFGFTQQAFIIE